MYYKWQVCSELPLIPGVCLDSDHKLVCATSFEL